MRKNNLMRRSVILLLLIVVSTAVQANPVSRSEALLKARQFMPTKQFAESRSWRHVKGVAAASPFYVFNDEGGRGFVIVSGDDRTQPILGYADSGSLDADSLPDNLRSWLDGYAEQMALLDNGWTARSAMAAAEVKPAIAPLITTTWNQNLPYNLMTPTYTDGSGNERHYVTGCVATALAQVMNYHQWPLNCPAIPAYTTHWQKIAMTELPPTTFKWNLMKDSYTSQETGNSADAVAELMRYVGQANSMDYNQGGSSASIHLDVMAELFSYSKNAWRARREDYTVVEWEKLIYRELSANRPVLYDGASGSVGHQFVCDGYDGEGFFHINWGWGGTSDGYFVISLANPDEKGIGGGSGTAGYAYRQTAIIGFQPASEDEEEQPRIEADLYDVAEATYSRSSQNADFENVSTDGVYIKGIYGCTPTTTCDVEVGWAVYKNEMIGNVIAYRQVTIDSRDGNTRLYRGPQTISFGAGLTDGQYKLVQVYRFLGDADWTIVSTKYCLYAQISDNTLFVRGFQREATFTVNSVDYSGEMGEGTEVNVTINITNTSDVMQETAYFWIKQSNNEWRKMAEGLGCVEPGETGNIHLSFTYMAGTFDVKITSDTFGEKVMGTSSVTIFPVQTVTWNHLLFSCNTGTKEAKLLKGDYKKYEWGVIEIPSSVSLDGTDYAVTKIDEQAFWNVTSLQGIVLPEGLLAVGERAFQFCYELREVQLPSTLKTIGDYAFNGCSSLNSVVSRMESPVAISRNVFTYNEWVNDSTQVEAFTKATLYVPEGAKANYQSDPAWSEFKNIYQGEYREAVLDGIIYGYPTGESIATIVGCDAKFLRDKDVVIPSAVEIEGKQRYVKAISERAFFQCCMRSLTFEPGIEEIGSSAFWNSNLLETLVLPEGLKTIGERAFESCYELIEVQLPSTLEAIGDYAFKSCTSLKSVVSRMESPVAISRNVFIYNEWINDSTWAEVFTRATLYVPEGAKANYQSAPVWSEFKNIYQGEYREITLDGILYGYPTGESVATIIGCDAEFLQDKDVVIPSAVEIEGKRHYVKAISESAFYQCSMRSLTFEPGIEEIGPSVFWNINSLQEIVLPEGLKTIGAQAFRYCYGLREVQLPSTLETIGDYAFNNCSSLNSVVSTMDTPIAISRNVFTYDEWINDSTWAEAFTRATLYVPEGTKANYQSAPVWSEFQNIYQGEYREAALDGIIYGYPKGESIATIVGCDAEFLQDKDVVIPSAVEIEGKRHFVKAIAEGAFYQCSMRSLTFEPGIEKIGSFTFYNINSLQEIVLPEGLKAIGNRAFQYCYYLREVQLPSTLETIGDYAFNNCSSLKSVVSRMESPVAISRNVFTYNTSVEFFTKATLYVPEGFKVKYQEADVWKEFSTISEFDPTGIPQVVANEKTPRIFDLSGRRLNRPRKGILIINGKKVLIP